MISRAFGFLLPCTVDDYAKIWVSKPGHTKHLSPHLRRIGRIEIFWNFAAMPEAVTTMIVGGLTFLKREKPAKVGPHPFLGRRKKHRENSGKGFVDHLWIELLEAAHSAAGLIKIESLNSDQSGMIQRSKVIRVLKVGINFQFCHPSLFTEIHRFQKQKAEAARR